jgi:RNA polymerase sigma-70 factor, ECF subfamily
MMDRSDGYLAAAAKKGNRAAFEILVARHQSRSLRLATLLLGNTGDAEDEVQNSFDKAFQHLGQYRGEAEFCTWLLRIVSNQCLMLMRTRRRARFVYLDEIPERGITTPLELAAAAPGPEDELGRKEMIDTLRSELRRLPPRLRHVLVLRDIDERPIADVADELGITVGAAKSRLLRARLELRARMEPHVQVGFAMAQSA